MDTTKEVCHPSDITVVVTFSHFVSIIYCVNSGESNSRPPGWHAIVLTVKPLLIHRKNLLILVTHISPLFLPVRNVAPLFKIRQWAPPNEE